MAMISNMKQMLGYYDKLLVRKTHPTVFDKTET
jgi:hypothetical protein